MECNINIYNESLSYVTNFTQIFGKWGWGKCGNHEISSTCFEVCHVESSNSGKIKSILGRFHPFTGHEGPQGEQRYSSTLFQTSTLEGVRGQRHAQAAPYPRERPGTHCRGGWVGLRSGLDWRGKSRPHTGIRSPDRPARSQSLYRLR